MQASSLFSKKFVAKIIKSSMEVLQHCHRKGIIHRDVKIDNILPPSHFAFKEIKLANFGWATRFSNDKLLFKYVREASIFLPTKLKIANYAWARPRLGHGGVGAMPDITPAPTAKL
jgi:serine/threonine protein kinase